MSVCLSVSLSLCLSVCLSVYLSLCLCVVSADEKLSTAADAASTDALVTDAIHWCTYHTHSWHLSVCHGIWGVLQVVRCLFHCQTHVCVLLSFLCATSSCSWISLLTFGWNYNRSEPHSFRVEQTDNYTQYHCLTALYRDYSVSLGCLYVFLSVTYLHCVVMARQPYRSSFSWELNRVV